MQKSTQGADWAVRTRMRKPGVLQALGTVAGLVLVALIYGMLIARPARKAAQDVTQSNAAIRRQTITDDELPRYRKAAAILDPELMSDAPEPHQYNRTFKNPCWHTEDGRLRCLPYAYFSGSFTGVGPLSKRILAHPHVAMDASVLSHWGAKWGYWSEYRNSMGSYIGGIMAKAEPQLQQDPARTIVIDASTSTLGLYWAGSGKAHRAFSTAAVACWQSCHDQNPGGGPEYDTCMDTKCLPEGRQADQEMAANASLPYNEMQLPMLMRALYGRSDTLPKFVFMLRDPAMRFYSAYFGTKDLVDHYGNASGSSSSQKGFIEYTRSQLKAWQSCVKRHGQEACIMRFETLSMEEEKVFYHCDQILRGMYASYLEIWFRYFPRNCFLILRSEEYFRNTTKGMLKVMKFLGLKPPKVNSTEWKRLVAAGPNVSYTEPHGWMPEGARRLLAKLYAPHNTQLVKLLGAKTEEKWDTWNKEYWYR